jgi:hypothetical protein
MDDWNSIFDWFDLTRGYGWSQAVAGARANQKELDETAASTRTFSARRENSGLFLSLAETRADQRGVLKFLFDCEDRLLWRSGQARADMPKFPDFMGGPNLTEWVAAARWMRLLVALWRSVRSQDRSSLQRHIHWQAERGSAAQVVYICKHHHHPDAELPADGVAEPIASREVRPGWLQILKPPDLTGPAVAFLKAKISAYLADLVRPQFLIEVKTTRLRLEPIPKTFFALLWLQFGEAVAEAKEYERCLSCGFYFERSPATARSNRRFCSNACRSRMYRKRQERAQRLYEEGMPLSQIARELETNVRTVRGWLKARRDE